MDFHELMRTVWADSLDGIVVADTDTRIIDVNPAYCRLAGYARDELVGQQTNVIRSGMTPRPVFNEMWRVLGSTGKWVGELINRRPDGVLWISFLSITRVVGPDGSPAAYVGIARDLTDRRELENQLRHQSTRLGALLEAIVSGVAMFDPNDRCGVVNHSLTNLLGCEADDLIGCTRSELQARLTILFREPDLLTPSEPMGTRNLSTEEPHPRYFTLLWGAVIASGAPLGQIFTFRDVTRETALDRMKSEFIATVSHELRTPMTSIKGALGLVLGGASGPVPEAQEELLTIARTNADRLIGLVNDVLDLSRIESGRLDLRCVPMDVNGAVTLAIQELDSVRQQRGLKVQITLEPNLPLVSADPYRIGQVLVNLLGNAYKFTEPGASITVRTDQVDGQLQVQVSDDGPGIPEDELERIFERFHRAPGTASQKAGGTGLGLSISRAIIEQHHGRIWAESQPGQGATFSFHLPIRSEE